MDREEVIAAIEKMRERPAGGRWRDEFVRDVSQRVGERQSRRVSLSADFQRAIIYLFILMTGLRYLRKADRRFLWPNIRSILFALLLLAGFVFQLVLAGVLVKKFGLGVYSLAGFMYLFLMEFIGLIWVLRKIERRAGGDELGMLRSCGRCGYDLSGHESVLGDELWVGPKTCPECGQQYPAVGE